MASSCEIQSFTASDGYKFFYRHWPAACDTPRGFVVALHGIQSHSGWYEYSSARLSQAGFDVRFLDRRGSGMNERSRGDAPHALRLVNDVVAFVNEVRHQRDTYAPASPVVLLAVSWGAKLATVAAARGDLVDGLALLYPGICSRVRPNRRQRLSLRLANSLGSREKLIHVPLDDARLFASSPNWQQFIREDSLALHKTTVGFLNASLDLDDLVAHAPESISLPVLLMLAGQDKIIDNAATRQFVARMSSHRQVVVEYPDAAHTLEFEPNRDRICDECIEWLSSVARSKVEAVGPTRLPPNAPHIDLTTIRSASSRTDNVLS